MNTRRNTSVERKRGLIRPEDIIRMMENHQRQRPVQGTKQEIDFEPVVRLYLPFSNCSWLLSEMETPEVAFGLCDLDMGFPELGSVYLPELEELRVQGLRVLQDVDFKPRMTISRYADEARRKGGIVID